MSGVIIADAGDLLGDRLAVLPGELDLPGDHAGVGAVLARDDDA